MVKFTSSVAAVAILAGSVALAQPRDTIYGRSISGRVSLEARSGRLAARSLLGVAEKEGKHLLKHHHPHVGGDDSQNDRREYIGERLVARDEHEHPQHRHRHGNSQNPMHHHPQHHHQQQSEVPPPSDADQQPGRREYAEGRLAARDEHEHPQHRHRHGNSQNPMHHHPQHHHQQQSEVPPPSDADQQPGRREYAEGRLAARDEHEHPQHRHRHGNSQNPMHHHPQHHHQQQSEVPPPSDADQQPGRREYTGEQLAARDEHEHPQHRHRHGLNQNPTGYRRPQHHQQSSEVSPGSESDQQPGRRELSSVESATGKESTEVKHHLPEHTDSERLPSFEHQQHQHRHRHLNAASVAKEPLGPQRLDRREFDTIEYLAERQYAGYDDLD